MKAEEVLRRYAAGERNFSGADLRGRNFKGQNLSGANFSHTDIRGANFTAANLSGANFTGAKAGVQRQAIISQVILLLVLSIMLGLLIECLAWLATYLFEPIPNQEAVDIVLAAIFTAGFILLLYSVTAIEIARFGLTLLTVLLGVAMVPFSGVIAFALPQILLNLDESAHMPSFAQIVIGTGVLLIPLLGAVLITMISASICGLAYVLHLELLYGIALAGASLSLAIVTSIFPTSVLLEFRVALFITVVPAFIYVSYTALAGDKIFALVRTIGVAFGTIGGTTFYKANLTDANFTNATLKSTYLREADLTRVCWKDARKLDRARVGNSYLQHPQIRQLVRTLQGQDQKFDRLNLSGINLQGANLQDASFVSTDLNDANLQDANLSRANLKQTQLDRADLTGACLTGAYIEDWGITNETKLDGVRCEYVFMRVPTKANPDPLRKPDNHRECFEDGDFADFIKPLFDTLDLYHNQDVDPRSIAFAFKDLSSNHPDAELRVVAIEAKGDDKFLLRVKTAEAANKSELSAEYFDRYNFYKSLPANDLRLLLAERDDRVRKLENMIGTALNQPSFHIQGDYMPENNISSGSGSFINTGDITGSTINLGQISGTVTNAINQLPASPESDRLKDLLVQLQAAIETDPQLPQDDKATALEQVKELAAAGQAPNSEEKRSISKRAAQMLKGIAASLPDAVKLTEACGKLLPMILPLVGL